MITVLFKWWRQRQRQTDLDVLWPICRAEAADLNSARAAFYVHCMMDGAWTKDFSERQIELMVNELR